MTLTLNALHDRIRLAINDENQQDVTPEFSPAQLDLFVAQAIEKFSHYRPHRLATTFTTVAQQDYYQVNANAIRVISVQWRPGVTTAPVPYNVLMPGSPPLFLAEWQDQGLVRARDQILRNFDSLTKTSWLEVSNPNSYLSGRWLRLFPAPQNAGEQVRYEYEAIHPLTASTRAYNSLEAGDADYIVRLVESIVLRRRARKMLSIPDSARGSLHRVGSKPAELMLNEARAIEQEVLDALSPAIGTRN